MSLVNDALKRAQLAQRSDPPSSQPGWVLRPVDPSVVVAPAMKRLPWLTAIGALLLAGLCLWQMLRGDVANTKPLAPVVPVTISRPSQATLSAPPKAVSIPAQPAARPAPQETLAGAPVAAPIRQDPPMSPPGQNTVAGPSGPATAPPPPLKLQAIVFDPRHPSAIINGRTLFLGDKFEEWRLAALNRKSVTLVAAGHTNVLTLR